MLLLETAVHADNEIQVLSNRMSAKTSNLQNEVALKNSECTRNYGQHVEARPSFTADEEGAQVFDDLHDLNCTFGKAHLLDLIVDDARAVQDAHDAPYRDDAAGIGKHSRHDTDERFFFEDGIGVDHANIRTGGGVDSGVDRVGFAAGGFFVQYEQARLKRTAIDGVKWSSRDVGNIEDTGCLKLIGLAQLVHGAITRTIVDYDDFEAGVFEAEQSSDTADDRALLIVR